MKNALLMVVDDEMSHMRAPCDTLGFEGYRVTGSESPAQALHALSESECELPLTHMMMPEMDGIELDVSLTASIPGHDLSGLSWRRRNPHLPL